LIDEDYEKDLERLYFVGHFSEGHNGEDWKTYAEYYRWKPKLRVGMKEFFFMNSSAITAFFSQMLFMFVLPHSVTAFCVFSVN
jgi:hypothetical protein